MKQNLIIISGKQGSGKTTIIEALISTIGEEAVYRMKPSELNHEIVRYLPIHNGIKAIIIDGLAFTKKNTKGFIAQIASQEEITIERQGEEPCRIKNPLWIVTTQRKLKWTRNQGIYMRIKEWLPF